MKRESSSSFTPILSAQRSFVSGIVKKTCIEPKQNTNINAYKNAGNCPYFQILGPPKSGPWLSPFQPNGNFVPAGTQEFVQLVATKTNISSI